MSKNIGRYRVSVVHCGEYGDPFKATPIQQEQFCLRETAVNAALQLLERASVTSTKATVVDLSDGFQVGYAQWMFDSNKQIFKTDFCWNKEVKQPYGWGG